MIHDDEVARAAGASSAAAGSVLREALFAQSPASIALYDADGRVAAMNPTYDRVWRARRDAIPGGYSLRADRRLAAAGTLPLVERAYAGESVVLPPIWYEAGAADGPGRDMWVRVRLIPVRDAAGAVSHVAAIHDDVTAQQRAAERARALAEASAALAGPLDVDDTLRRFAAAAVPALGDWCIVDLVDDSGPTRVVHRAAVAHADPAKLPLLHEMAERYPPDGSRPTLSANILRTGRGEVVPHVPDEIIDRVSYDPSHAAIVRALGMRSYVVVPLATRGRLLGVVAFVSAGRALDADDLAVAEEIGRRAALAVDNARLFAAEQGARAAAEASAARAGALQAVTSALIGARTAVDVAQAVLGPAMAVIRAERGALGVVTSDGRELELVRTRGYDADVVRRFQRTPLAGTFPLAEAARNGGTILLRDAVERAARYPMLADVRARNGDGALAVLPLATSGRPLGAIGFNFDAPRDWPAADEAFLTALAQQCGQALERVALSEEAERARADAERASRAKSEFLAVMSHELRTPLNAIGGYAELLELGIRGPVTPQQREDLGRIQRSQRHLLGLINEVLNYARLESGAVSYDITDVHVAEVVASAEALIAPQLRARGLVYVSDGCAPDVVARADREKLRQVLLNLLSNAVKFTDARDGQPGRVEVRCACRGDGRVRVAVRDTGVGIPADKFDAVFEPFVQVNSSLTRTAEGTGLGLAISRDLARGMGGELTVESEEGVGSTFTVELPGVVSPVDPAGGG